MKNEIRPVKYLTGYDLTDSKLDYKKPLYSQGFFLGFGIACEEGNDGNGGRYPMHYTTAIIESNEGKLIELPTSQITFEVPTSSQFKKARQ
jgi:hypothetical protein